MDKKILIVDDEVDTVEMTVEFFEFKGFTNVMVAYNPEKALELIEKEKPDLILLDIQLEHEIDGIEILKRTKEQLSPESLVIMCTAHKNQYENKAEKYKADGFWYKPMTAEQLEKGIKEMLSVD